MPESIQSGAGEEFLSIIERKGNRTAAPIIDRRPPQPPIIYQPRPKGGVRGVSRASAPVRGPAPVRAQLDLAPTEGRGPGRQPRSAPRQGGGARQGATGLGPDRREGPGATAPNRPPQGGRRPPGRKRRGGTRYRGTRGRALARTHSGAGAPALSADPSCRMATSRDISKRTRAKRGYRAPRNASAIVPHGFRLHSGRMEKGGSPRGERKRPPSDANLLSVSVAIRITLTAPSGGFPREGQAGSHEP